MTRKSNVVDERKPKTPLLACVSEVLKEQRLMLGISQEQIAARSGLHRTYISDVERGARNVSLVSLERLSAAVELPVSQIMILAEAKRGSQGGGGGEK